MHAGDGDLTLRTALVVLHLLGRDALDREDVVAEGGVDAFDDIGGVPVRHIKYDNLTSAVTTVIYGTGRRRTENPRWVLFRSHYGFDAFYCLPGIDGAHEKGGVEGEVGRFRRTWLSPMNSGGVKYL